jgi:hypothetical protein
MSGKNNLARLKKHTLWYDPFCFDFYIVLKKYGSAVTIIFINDPFPITVRTRDCLEDKFIKKLSSLEIELL